MVFVLRLTLILLLILGACAELTDNVESTTAITQNNNWEMVADGLEQDTVRHETAFFQVVRIDPEQYTFRAHYRPNEPLTIDEWQVALPDAQVIINANFFTAENTILGLLISDGVVFGSSYQDRGGTFFVDNDMLGIRSNITEPYQGEAFSQAIQAFPMLVMNGEAAYNNSSATAISRRTIIAQDSDGQIILMVTSGFGISLYNLSQYLAVSDLNIERALNLDGGGSTMMYIAPSDSTVLSFDPVPAVLAIYQP